MKIQQLMEHHGIRRNPFAEEDAQTDPVFKDYCIDSIYHPAWDKVYGDPQQPATAIVFGEKGAGKTAMRLQIARHLAQWNDDHRDHQTFVIHYDDFNHFLDRFGDRVGSRRRPQRILSAWRLWDHMDAILTLGVTGLVDRILQVKQPSPQVEASIDSLDLPKLDRHQARDLLLLAACYDQSTAETYQGRWHRLRKKLKFFSPWAYWDLALGAVWSLLVLGIVVALHWYEVIESFRYVWIYLVVLLAGWIPRGLRMLRMFWTAYQCVRHVRTGNLSTEPLRRVLMHLAPQEFAGQPLPNKQRTDDRYELLGKLQGVLQSLGFDSIVVLVDRIDEPHLINGSAELMKMLLWPMLDNKFLKHPGIGSKLMLPVELRRFLEKEDASFHQRARLDKQNMISSFQWSGQALCDVANARIQACAQDGTRPVLRQLISESVSDARLLEALKTLRVPRHLFKFLYRLLMTHCNTFSEHQPQWTVSAETFEACLALYVRDQQLLERGLSDEAS